MATKRRMPTTPSRPVSSPLSPQKAFIPSPPTVGPDHSGTRSAPGFDVKDRAGTTADAMDSRVLSPRVQQAGGVPTAAGKVLWASEGCLPKSKRIDDHRDRAQRH